MAAVNTAPERTPVKPNLVASLFAAAALAACGNDVTPQSAGSSAGANTAPASEAQSAPAQQPAAEQHAAQPEKADEAKAEPQTKEDGEKKPE
jgi:hypothetical protein